MAMCVVGAIKRTNSECMPVHKHTQAWMSDLMPLGIYLEKEEKIKQQVMPGGVAE